MNRTEHGQAQCQSSDRVCAMHLVESMLGFFCVHVAACALSFIRCARKLCGHVSRSVSLSRWLAEMLG